MDTLLILYVLMFLLFIGISIPLIQKRIRPNFWYGFRTRKTLRNPEVWYPANAYGGKLLLIASVINLLFVVVFYLMPGMTVEIYNCLIPLLSTVTLTIALIFSLRYIHKL